MKQLFFIIALLSILNLTMAQNLTEGLQVVNDTELYPMQPLAKPGYLQTAIDPSFGTTIRRISNAAPGETIVPMYSTVQAWNADESRMILYSRTDGHILLNGTDYVFIRNLDDIQPDDIDQIFWDFNDPDIFYYLDKETKEFISYSVSSRNKSVIVNLETRVPNCNGSFSMGNDIQSMSWDSDVFCFRCENESAYYYRISTDDLVKFDIPNINGAAPMPAPSGLFFYHDRNVYNAEGNLHEPLNESSIEHSNLGRLSDGTDVHIAVSFAEGPEGGCLGDIVVHNMETGDCYTVTSQNQGYNYSQSGTHISALSHKNTQGGWVAASMIGYDRDGQLLLDQELVIARVDQGNIQVGRIGHHRSDEDEPELGFNEPGNNYFGEPHAVISPKGTRVLFGSDWSGDEDGISIDSYVVELPSYEPEEPGELIIFCPDDASVANASDIVPGIAQFVASCGLSDLTVSEPVINGEPNANGTTYTYTHTAIDNCGGIVTCNQVFTIANNEEQNAVTPGNIKIDPTFEHIGILYNISGDANLNSELEIFFKEQGAGTFKKGAITMRSHPGLIIDENPYIANHHAGSAMFLQPNTTYEIHLILSDPDGGGTTTTITASTRALTVETANFQYVAPGNGGGNGTVANPYLGLQTAADNAQAGITFIVRPGLYNSFNIATDGTANAPVTFRSETKHSAIVDGNNTSNGVVILGDFTEDSLQHIIIDGFHIRNGEYGIDAQHTQYLTIKNCKIDDVTWGIYNRRENGWEHDQYITNNFITGRTAWLNGGTEHRGVDIRGNRNVISFNTIKNFDDGVSTDGEPYSTSYAMDIHNNDIQSMADDLIEVDGTISNTRVYRNRMYNGRAGVSMAPVFGGPCYVFRNEMYNMGDDFSAYKMNRGPSGLVIVHNSSSKIENGMSSPVGWQNTFFKNNVVIGSRYCFEEFGLVNGSVNDWDYNAYHSTRPGINVQDQEWFKWDDNRFGNITELRNGTDIETNGLAFDLNADIEFAPPPTDYTFEYTPGGANAGAISFQPTDGSVFINNGIQLDNLNDGYVTDPQPDRGAYELGEPLPVFGAVCPNDELTITCPDDATVASEDDIDTGTPQVSPICDPINFTVSDAVINGEPNANGTTYTYTYTVTDGCGRMATCNQVFTIVNDNNNECKVIDFDLDDDGNDLLPGTIINNQYNDFDVSTENTHLNLYPMLFDTANPTSNDFDIGTPNERYDGPGIGDGGQNNTDWQGNALVVSKNRFVPNETEGKLIFNFYCSVTIKTIDLLDMKCGQNEIELYDENDILINVLNIPGYGVNSFNTFDVFTSGVHKMIVDLNCGGGVTGFKYCKDDSSGDLCTPELCNEYSIDHGVNGVGWNNNATYGTLNLGNEVVVIKIDDDGNHILRNTRVEGKGLQIGIDPFNVSDQLEIHYSLSKASSNIVFDITDLDRKFNYSKQQEAVCVYGLLGNRAEPVLPNIISLDGAVDIEDNCAESTTNSAYGNDESILVEFTDCIDRFVIEYGTGSNSPTQYPSYSKITIGKSVFTIEQCEVGCGPNNCNGDIADGDDDGDGICNNEDTCPGFDDNMDENNNGIPDGCETFRLGMDFDFNLHPNPADAGSIITISAPEAYENADLIIFDELGRLIEQNKLNLLDGLNTWQLPANLKTGIYFVKIRTNSFNSKVHKLIIVQGN